MRSDCVASCLIVSRGKTRLLSSSYPVIIEKLSPSGWYVKKKTYPFWSWGIFSLWTPRITILPDGKRTRPPRRSAVIDVFGRIATEILFLTTSSTWAENSEFTAALSLDRCASAPVTRPSIITSLCSAGSDCKGRVWLGVNSKRTGGSASLIVWALVFCLRICSPCKLYFLPLAFRFSRCFASVGSGSS